jgi:F-type H+-transporting ATPase subunit gamma
MIVPVSADRGLCGGFNSSINRETFKLVKSLEKDGKNVQLMPVGKKE